MGSIDLFRFSATAVIAHRARSILTALGIAVGITAVILLTSIGEGVHRFVLGEFTQFGTNLLAITPGRTETFGIPGAAIGSVRPLTLEDADALERLEPVSAVVPVVMGNAAVESEGRSRRAAVFGVGAEMPQVWSMAVGLGRFLPDADNTAPRAYAVLGARVRRELFPHSSPLGRPVRVGGDRYRVIGVMAEKGQFLGFDLDDAVYVPAAKALTLFNREGLHEIDVLYRATTPVATVRKAVERLMRARHRLDDFTVTSQQQMLDVLGSVLNVLTIAVGALGGISLFVGGVGILTIMTISVSERTAEIGLLRALGARRAEIHRVFLFESLLLASAGGTAGLVLGLTIVGGIALLAPELPVHPSPGYVVLAVLVAVLIGLAAGVAPARNAARLVPVEALRGE